MSSLPIQEYVLAQTVEVLSALDMEQFVEGESFQIYAIDHQGWTSLYQMTFEITDGQLELDRVFSLDDTFEQLAKDSGYLAPFITEYTRF